MSSIEATSTDDAVQRAADQLWEAARSRVPCAPVRELLPANDVATAYKVQEINTRRSVDAGRRRTGFKIGLTSRAVQQQLGVDQPDFGVLFADMAYADAEEVAWSRTLQAKAEAEIALVLDRDLTADQPTLADLIDATAYALPAIEIVGSRVANWKIGIVDTVADNASSGLYVLGGTPRSLSDFDARLCGMVMERRGDQVSLGVGAACLGHPLQAALWLARKMSALGSPLRAGDLVLTGALGPMVSVQPGDVLEAHISGLGSVRAVFGQEASQ